MQFEIFKSQVSDDIESKRRASFLYIGNAICTVIGAFFIIRVNTKFGYHDSNLFMITVWLLSLSSFFIFKKTKNYLLSVSVFWTFAIMIVVWLIYIAGGVKAPGIFWLVFIPLLSNTLYGKKGILVGGMITILTLIVFKILPQFIEPINIVETGGDYLNEKLSNMFLFTIAIGIYLYNFSKSYETAQTHVVDKSGEVETLLRVIVHDISTPLTTINYKIKTLGVDPDHKDLKKIETALGTINELVTTIKKVKSIQDNKEVIVFEKVDVLKAIEDVSLLLTDRLTEKKLTIEIENYIGEKVYSNLEESIFKNQILLNILTNSIKFSPENEKIKIVLIKNEKFCELKIQDFGIGMPKHIIDNLFKLRGSVSRKGTSGEKGTGFGMPIMKYFVDMMGLKINVVSKEKTLGFDQSGTTFIITFKNI